MRRAVAGDGGNRHESQRRSTGYGVATEAGESVRSEGALAALLLPACRILFSWSATHMHSVIVPMHYANSLVIWCVAQVFDAVDVDGDGTITSDEMLLALQATGEACSPSDIRETMSALDVDGDGGVRCCPAQFIHCSSTHPLSRSSATCQLRHMRCSSCRNLRRISQHSLNHSLNHSLTHSLTHLLV